MSVAFSELKDNISIRSTVLLVDFRKPTSQLCSDSYLAPGKDDSGLAVLEDDRAWQCVRVLGQYNALLRGGTRQTIVSPRMFEMLGRPKLTSDTLLLLVQGIVQ